MKKLRSKLSYANVMATIAVFIALGGLAVASGLPKNSVGSKQIKKNAVTAAKIKKGAVTGAKVDISSLGTVPQAGNALTLQGQAPSTISASSKLRCPGDMSLVSGICFETSTRPATSMSGAGEACADAGRFLPSVPMLWAFQIKTFESQPEYEWAGAPYANSGKFEVTISSASAEGVTYSHDEASGDRPYRCAVTPSN